MATRKADLKLPRRATAYVSRETDAAELQISPETWAEICIAIQGLASIDLNSMRRCTTLNPRNRLPGRSEGVKSWDVRKYQASSYDAELGISTSASSRKAFATARRFRVPHCVTNDAATIQLRHRPPAQPIRSKRSPNALGSAAGCCKH
jgi:hypothetical protein